MSDVAAIEKELLSIKDLLTKMQREGKVKSGDELVPLQDRLAAVDTQRKDGKWIAKDGSIPPGQANLIQLLEDCYEIKDQIMDRL